MCGRLQPCVRRYALGLRFRGGRRPPRLQWEWRQLVEGTRKFQRGDHAIWLGEIDAGVQLNLKGEEPEWEAPDYLLPPTHYLLPTTHYLLPTSTHHYSPLPTTTHYYPLLYCRYVPTYCECYPLLPHHYLRLQP